MHRSFRYKLAPTPDQERLFGQFSGVCRLIYNLALEQRRDFRRSFRKTTGKQLNFVTQSHELTLLRAEFDWIAAVSQTSQQNALRDLDRAFAKFFAGRAGFPTPRKRGINDAFRLKGREVEITRLNRKWSAVRIPKIGWVKFRDTRPVVGSMKTATVSRDKLGWHVSFVCEVEHETPGNQAPAVGIDRGVANTLTLSTGERLSLPCELEAIERRHRAAQSVLARRKRGSARRTRALRRCAKLTARRARIRLDWQHKTALGIAQRFGVVVLEDLKVANMTRTARGTVETPGTNVRQKAGLNRSILNQGWFAFETILAYKLDERGGTLVKVNPAFTSQTCSACGSIDKQSRESQASFACRHCDFRAHADHNAAINILRRNTSFMRMEEGHKLSDEVRTGLATIRHENPAALAVGGC